jgi:hypothetical protein
MGLSAMTGTLLFALADFGPAGGPNVLPSQEAHMGTPHSDPA